jgi:succinate-semialdehyde dehydrogenase/glutarate-semialdehyde dehydrogenase
MKTMNPATGRLQGEIRYLEMPELHRKVQSLRDNQPDWSRMPLPMRLSRIKKLRDTLARMKKSLAIAISEEMGKPIKLSLQEVDDCISLCDYCIKGAAFALKSKPSAIYEPLGTVLIISPWNYPLFFALKHSIPALCAGNVVVVKHASVVPSVTRELGKMLKDAGLGDVALIMQSKPEHALSLIEKNLVDGVCVVGSSLTGRIVAKKAGENLKPHLLELGGSDAFIVFDDANLALAAKEAIHSRMLNSGQNCDSAKRLIVHKKIAHEFENMLISEVNKLKVGSPLSLDTDIGPVISESSCAAMAHYVEDAKAKGGRIIYGGQRLNRAGFYFMPTLIADASIDMKFMQDEVFGPVLPIITFSNDKEALQIANNTPYGLGASVWTKSKSRAQAMVQGIDAGTIAINKLASSDIAFSAARKASGYGLERNHGSIRAFTEIKNVQQ